MILCVFIGALSSLIVKFEIFFSALNSVVFSHIMQYSVSKKITEMANRSGKCSRSRENFSTPRKKQVVMWLIVRTSQCAELSCLYCQPKGS